MNSAIIQVLRPHQWSKNLVLLLPVITAHKWSEPTALVNVLFAMMAFCLASSSIYVLNDWRDREHILKRFGYDR